MLFPRFVNLQIWKTLETTDKTLMDMIVGKDYDITQLFQEEWQPPKSPLERDKRRGGRFETEEFYLSVSISFWHTYLLLPQITEYYLLQRLTELIVKCWLGQSEGDGAL